MIDSARSSGGVPHRCAPVFRLRPLCGALLVFGCANVQPVFAAEASDAAPRALSTVVVRGVSDSGLTAPSLPEVRRELNHATGGVAIVDGDTVREGRVSTFSDALGYAPGVFAQSRFGAEETRLSIRGSGLQRTFHLRGVRVMQDGVPVNLADGGGDFQAIEPLATRYIEVYRGANALQYGASTLGGAVNYVTPTGHDSEPLLARGEVGSFGYLRSQLAAGGRSGAFDAYASIATFSQDGFRRHAHQNAERIVANAGWRPSDQVETRFYVARADSDSELPGSLSKAQLQADPRQANAGNVTSHQKRDIDLLRLANRTVYRAGDTRYEFGAFYSDKTLFHPIFQVLDQDTQDAGLQGRIVSEAPWAGRANRLVAGLTLLRNDTTDDRWVNVGGRRGARANKLDQEVNGVEAYVEEQHAFLPSWTAAVGTQYTHTTRKSTDLCYTGGPLACAGVDESFNVTYSGWSPKLGVRHDVSERVQVFANLSRSYEPPSFGELTGGAKPVINKAQRATTLEIGTRGAQPGFQWDLAAYHAQVRDELLARNIPDPTNPALTISTTANAPKTIHQGFELAGDGQFAGAADWRAAGLINRFKFDGDPQFGNNALPGAPKSLLRAEVGYRVAAMAGGPLRVAVNTEWSPQRYAVDMANTLFADSHVIWGLRVRQEIGRQVSWFVDGRNLADRKYAATTGVIQDARTAGANLAQFLPGDGRSVYAGLEWKL